MKKTIALLAAILFLGSICATHVKAAGWPDPSCPSGDCVPMGGGH